MNYSQGYIQKKSMIGATKIFEKNLKYYNDKYRYIINEGGSSSGKTYSILQLLVLIAIKSKKSISIVRDTFPEMRKGLIRDFLIILDSYNIYDDKSWNKSDSLYTFQNGSIIEFFPVSIPARLRGPRRDILFINEANGIDYDSYVQLTIRTKETIFIDYNPADEDHWVYSIPENKNSILLKSTYKDNPFLSQSIKDELENLINTDENYYKVYVLGEKPTKNQRVFTHFQRYINDPSNVKSISYGLDLGYNDPCVLIETIITTDGHIYAKELIYESKLTTSDLIERLKNIPLRGMIYSDHRPEVIEEIRRSGINIKLAKKSIIDGIMLLKSKQVYIHEYSSNLWRESKLYMFKTDKNGFVSDKEVVDRENHCCDALRYSVYSLNTVKQDNKWY